MQVELHGHRAKSVTSGRATPVFSDEIHPTWHIQPGNIRSGKLYLDGDTFTGIVAVHVENRDGFAIARAAPNAYLGEYQAELSIDGHVQWQGSLRWFPNRYEQPRLRPIVASWSQDKDEARRKLQSLCDEGPDWMRFQTYRVWGGLEWSQTATSAGEVWARGFEAMLREGSIQSALTLAGSAAFISLETGDLGKATSLTERMKPLSEAHGNAFNRADLLHLQARLEMDWEDATQALDLARQSAMVAWRAGDDGMWCVSTMLAGDQLLTLGRFAESRDTLRQVGPRASRPRNRLMAELNLLWAELWGHEAGVWTLEAGYLEQRFEALLAKCQDPKNGAVAADLANVKSCLAYLALRRDDVEDAGRWLKDASTWKETELGMERWFIRLIIAETQLRSGQLAEAEAALQAIIAGVQKEAGDVSPHTVIAHRLRADIHEAQGRKTQAVQALNEAWQASLRVARRLSQIGAKNHFLHLHRALPMRYARALLETGDALGAAAVIDEHLYEGGSQIRALSTRRTKPELWRPVKEARAALATARRVNCELYPPDERVVCKDRVKTAQQDVLAAELSFYAQLKTPRRAEAKAALAQRRARLKEREGLLLSAGDGEDLQAFLLTKKRIVPAQGKEALATLAPHLEKLSMLQIAGPLDPWAEPSPDGKPWAARLPMYASQYARTPAAPGTGQFSGPPLVVSDPSANLPKTAKRIKHWQERLGVTALKRESASRAAIITRLKERPSLFFFSGHGEHDDLDHTSTRIILSESHIDLQDVLADRLAARLIVLNGCSTGATEAGYGAGLPEAFMHQGTEAVLGTTRTLKDGEAEAFLDRFFDAVATQAPALAMRDAVKASIEAKDDSWKHLRLWR